MNKIKHMTEEIIQGSRFDDPLIFNAFVEAESAAELKSLYSYVTPYSHGVDQRGIMIGDMDLAFITGDTIYFDGNEFKIDPTKLLHWVPNNQEMKETDFNIVTREVTERYLENDGILHRYINKIRSLAVNFINPLNINIDRALLANSSIEPAITIVPDNGADYLYDNIRNITKITGDNKYKKIFLSLMVAILSLVNTNGDDAVYTVINNNGSLYAYATANGNAGAGSIVGVWLTYCHEFYKYSYDENGNEILNPTAPFIPFKFAGSCHDIDGNSFNISDEGKKLHLTQFLAYTLPILKKIFGYVDSTDVTGFYLCDHDTYYDDEDVRYAPMVPTVARVTERISSRATGDTLFMDANEAHNYKTRSFTSTLTEIKTMSSDNIHRIKFGETSTYDDALINELEIMPINTKMADKYIRNQIYIEDSRYALFPCNNVTEQTSLKIRNKIKGDDFNPYNKVPAIATQTSIKGMFFGDKVSVGTIGTSGKIPYELKSIKWDANKFLDIKGAMSANFGSVRVSDTIGSHNQLTMTDEKLTGDLVMHPYLHYRLCGINAPNYVVHGIHIVVTSTTGTRNHAMLYQLRSLIPTKPDTTSSITVASGHCTQHATVIWIPVDDRTLWGQIGLGINDVEISFNNGSSYIQASWLHGRLPEAGNMVLAWRDDLADTGVVKSLFRQGQIQHMKEYNESNMVSIFKASDLNADNSTLDLISSKVGDNLYVTSVEITEDEVFFASILDGNDAPTYLTNDSIGSITTYTVYEVNDLLRNTPGIPNSNMMKLRGSVSLEYEQYIYEMNKTSFGIGIPTKKTYTRSTDSKDYNVDNFITPWYNSVRNTNDKYPEVMEFQSYSKIVSKSTNNSGMSRLSDDQYFYPTVFHYDQDNNLVNTILVRTTVDVNTGSISIEDLKHTPANNVIEWSRKDFENSDNAIYANNYTQILAVGDLPSTHPPVDMNHSNFHGITLDIPRVHSMINVVYEDAQAQRYRYSTDSGDSSTIATNGKTALFCTVQDGDYLVPQRVITTIGKYSHGYLLNNVTAITTNLLDDALTQNPNNAFCGYYTPEKLELSEDNYYSFMDDDYSNIKDYLLRTIYSQNIFIDNFIDEVMEGSNPTLKELVNTTTVQQTKALLDAQNILALDGALSMFEKISNLGESIANSVTAKVDAMLSKFTGLSSSICASTALLSSSAYMDYINCIDAINNDHTLIERYPLITHIILAMKISVTASDDNVMPVILSTPEGMESCTFKPETLLSGGVLPAYLIQQLFHSDEWDDFDVHCYFNIRLAQRLRALRDSSVSTCTINFTKLEEKLEDSSSINNLVNLISKSHSSESDDTLILDSFPTVVNYDALCDIPKPLENSQESPQIYDDTVTLFLVRKTSDAIFIPYHSCTTQVLATHGDYELVKILASVTAISDFNEDLFNYEINKTITNLNAISALDKVSVADMNDNMKKDLELIETMTATAYDSVHDQFTNPTVNRELVRDINSYSERLQNLLNYATDETINEANISNELMSTILTNVDGITNDELAISKSALVYLQNNLATYRQEVLSASDNATTVLTGIYNASLEDAVNDIEDTAITATSGYSQAIANVTGKADEASSDATSAMQDVSASVTSAIATIDGQIDAYVSGLDDKRKSLYAPVLGNVKSNVQQYGTNIISVIQTTGMYNGMSSAMSAFTETLTTAKSSTTSFLSAMVARISNISSVKTSKSWQMDDSSNFDKSVDLSKFYRALGVAGSAIKSAVGYTFAIVNGLVSKISKLTRDFIRSVKYDGASVTFRRSGYETIDIPAYNKVYTRDEFITAFPSIYQNVFLPYYNCVDYNFTLSYQHGSMFVFFTYDSLNDTITVTHSPILFTSSYTNEGMNANDFTVFRSIYDAYKNEIKFINLINSNIVSHFPDFFSAVKDLYSMESPFYSGQVSALVNEYDITLLYDEETFNNILTSSPYAPSNAVSDSIIGWSTIGFGAGAYMMMSGLIIPGAVVAGASAVVIGVTKIVEDVRASSLKPEEIMEEALSDNTYGNALITNADIYNLVHTFPIQGSYYIMKHTEILAASELLHSGNGRTTARGNFVPLGFVKGSPRIAVHLKTDDEIFIAKLGKSLGLVAALAGITGALWHITKSARLNRKLDKINALSWNVPDELSRKDKIKMQQKYQKKLRKTSSKIDSGGTSDSTSNAINLGIPDYNQVMAYALTAASMSGNNQIADNIQNLANQSRVILTTEDTSDVVNRVDGKADDLNEGITAVQGTVDSINLDTQSVVSKSNEVLTDTAAIKQQNIATLAEVGVVGGSIAALEIAQKATAFKSFLINMLKDMGYSEAVAEELLPTLISSQLFGDKNL